MNVSGRIMLEEADIHSLSMEELRKNVGLMFQTPAPFPFSIYKNLTYAPVYYGIRDKKKLEKIVEETLKLTGLYEEVAGELHKSALKLSGGQKQRVAIARAIVNNPKLLLADEPTGALDTKSGDQVMELFKELNDDGVTIVMITHEPDIARCAKRIMYIRDGELHGEKAGEQE